jgi:hypothetical protein
VLIFFQVLILLPMRSTALKFVKKLIELAPKSQTVSDMPRQFSPLMGLFAFPLSVIYLFMQCFWL